MSVYQNINGTLTRMDASDLVQLAATDTSNILGGGAGATTDGQTLVDQLAADDVQIKTDLSDYHVVPSKNYLNVTGKSRDIITVNSDNSITFNGSTTGVAKAFSFVNDSQLSSLRGTYVFSAGVNVGSNIWLTLTTNNGGIDLHDAESVTVTLTDSVYLTGEVHSYMSDGVTFSNFTVYPMLCTAADYAADPSYEPYWECMRDGKLDITDEQVLGAWNLAKITATTQTAGGTMTVTVNSDKSIKLNTSGATTSSVGIILGEFELPAGTFYFTGGLCESSDANTNRLALTDENGGYTELARDLSGYNRFTLSEPKTVRIRLYVLTGSTFSNKMIYPMIATKDNSPYAPFAMTNRELTEVKAGTVQTTYTWNGSLEKCGNLCILNFSIATGTSEVAANTTLATVSYKPKSSMYFFVRSNMDGQIKLATINTLGQVSINVSLSNGGNLFGEAVYFSY